MEGRDTGAMQIKETKPPGGGELMGFPFIASMNRNPTDVNKLSRNSNV